MINLKKAHAWRLSGISLISLFLCQTLGGYQQGSYFLFHLTQTPSEKAVEGRIAVSVSEIESQSAKAERISASKAGKSEFQIEITSLHSTEKSTQLLKGGTTAIQKEALQTESSFGKSSFGEEQTAPSGFFFTY